MLYAICCMLCARGPWDLDLRFVLFSYLNETHTLHNNKYTLYFVYSSSLTCFPMVWFDCDSIVWFTHFHSILSIVLIFIVLSLEQLSVQSFNVRPSI